MTTPNFKQEAEKLLTFAEHCGDHEVVRKAIAFFLETACEKGFEAAKQAAAKVAQDHAKLKGIHLHKGFAYCVEQVAGEILLIQPSFKTEGK